MSPKKLPAWFIGHGAPTFLLSDNAARRFWKSLPAVLASQTSQKPRAILSISAHWQTSHLCFSGQLAEPTIQHDFSGFPAELYDIRWPLPSGLEVGQDLLAQCQTLGLQVESDPSYPLDHGSWVPLREAWPKPEIPVFQLSICPQKGTRWHYELGQKLAFLREQGVLIIANGGISHNLRQIHWRMAEDEAVDWAQQFMQAFETALKNKDIDALLDPISLPFGAQAVPTLDHYLPFLVFAGLTEDLVTETLYQGWMYGSLACHAYSTI